MKFTLGQIDDVRINTRTRIVRLNQSEVRDALGAFVKRELGVQDGEHVSVTTVDEEEGMGVLVKITEDYEKMPKQAPAAPPPFTPMPGTYPPR